MYYVQLTGTLLRPNHGVAYRVDPLDVGLPFWVRSTWVRLLEIMSCTA